MPKYRWIPDKPTDSGAQDGVLSEGYVTVRQALRDADEDARHQIAAAWLVAISALNPTDPERASALKADVADARRDFDLYFHPQGQ